MSKRILFFGNERLATGVTTTAPTLRDLLKAGYDVAAVVIAQKDAGPSRSKNRELEIAKLAVEHNIPLLVPEKLNDAVEELAALEAEAAVLVAYGKVVPQAVIDLFPKGIINIHPSLLPKHRGPTPIESAILAGEAELGVSLMQLSSQLDAGPVFAQTQIYGGTDSPKMTKQMLADLLLSEGGKLLLQHLPAILNGELQPTPQDAAEATYDQRISKRDGQLDWQKDARELEREFRAYAEWPRSRATIGGKDVIVTDITLLDSAGEAGSLQTENGELIVFCKWGALQINKLIPAGKQEMTGEAFLAGYKI